jgi:hypothetical protein
MDVLGLQLKNQVGVQVRLGRLSRAGDPEQPGEPPCEIKSFFMVGTVLNQRCPASSKAAVDAGLDGQAL